MLFLKASGGEVCLIAPGEYPALTKDKRITKVLNDELHKKNLNTVISNLISLKFKSFLKVLFSNKIHVFYDVYFRHVE